METLNKNATKIFCMLIEKMKGSGHLKIVNEPFMPLTIEKITDGLRTPWGEVEQYSLCHYYEQNGDLMQDPEVCFLIAGHNSDQTLACEEIKVFPYTFTQANLGIYEEPISFKEGKIFRYNPKMQAEITLFANRWLRNINEQGFLKK